MNKTNNSLESWSHIAQQHNHVHGLYAKLGGSGFKRVRC
uniref:Uncharacterized protein n=1 Tax=Arundo donax TaxID=35708 RepID=A0A0A9AJK5_ARUDO